jgi:hypothetical protein
MNLMSSQKTVMIVGLGDLGAHVLDMLSRSPERPRIVVAGRKEEPLVRRKNLARYAALHLGATPDLDHVVLDLDDEARTAEVLSAVNPDIVFSAVSLQSWRVITELPKPVFDELDEAQFGPWLPMHLTPVHALMRAVKLSGVRARVVNSAFPDCVNAVLGKVGLAPTIGIGNVANIIPALRTSAAFVLDQPVSRVRVSLVAQHYFTHRVPRCGDAGGAPFHLTATLDGEDVTKELDVARVLSLLTTQFRRQGGLAGQMLTAASAMSVLSAMLEDAGRLAHAPGPNGLPGGYPVRITARGGEPVLPEGLSLGDAIRMNEGCQRRDGIERIDQDGTVHFTEQEMAIMKRMLGYECRSMRIEESGAWARELRAKYVDFAKRHRRP